MFINEFVDLFNETVQNMLPALWLCIGGFIATTETFLVGSGI